MKLLTLLLIFLFFTNSLFALTIVDYNYPQVKGIQIFVIPKKYENNLDTYMYRIKKSGINTILFRVFQNNGDRVHFYKKTNCKSGVYYKTSNACMVDDTLKEVIKYAKKYDLKVYAWMATRSLSFLKEKYGFEKVFKRPGFKKKQYAVSIFNNNIRKELISLFKDLSLYDINGILIQDDYILKYNEGASTQAKRRFYIDNGWWLSSNKLFTKTTYTKAYHEWNIWKMKQLSYLLNEIKTEVKKINPGIKFAVNIYYETPVFPDRGLSWYSQSISQYINYGFEYLAFMGYHEQIADEMKISAFSAINYINKSIRNMKKITENYSRIMVKYQISSFKNGKYLPTNELKTLCKTIKNYPNISYVAVPFDDLKDLNYICK